MKKLSFILFLLLSFPISIGATAGVHGLEGLKRDGVLKLYHSHLEETMDVTYESRGIVKPEALKQIDHFMRSRDGGGEIEMNIDLIRLIDHIQDHFEAETVEVISGYRSAEFNRQLKQQGHNVAEESFHTKGMAVDIHLDEITEKKIQSYARKLKVGGVGYYPDLLMVHLDLGPVRFWQEDSFTDRTDIGIFNHDVNLSLKTDHLFYIPGKKQRLVLLNQAHLPLKPNLVLEHFFHARWNSVPLMIGGGWQKSAEEGREELTWEVNFSEGMNLPYGKYRWKISTRDGRVQYSNEFYLKKK